MICTYSFVKRELRVGVFASLLAAPAFAAQCNFSEMGGTLIDFGVRSAAINSDIIGIDDVRFTCSDGIVPTIGYTVAISAGSSGNFAQRTLQHGGDVLNYNIYTEATFTQIFGDGQPGSNSSTVSGLCVSGQSCIVPVYGRINGGQSVSSGVFTDEVVVTISF